jgi:DNA primase
MRSSGCCRVRRFFSFMATVIPKRTLEDIRFRNDIADVIGSYFTIQRAGSAFKALCPFHKEKTPSFHVNPQRQIFHCFGCGAGGDVFKFVMQYEGVDFIGAVKILAQRANIPLELEDTESGGPDKSVLYRLHEEVSKLYHQALIERKSAAIAREYLEKRKLPGEIIEEFFLGYAPDRWDAVLKWAESNKYSFEQVETAGLILKRSGTPGNATEYYDRFRHRLMFPIRDEQGRVIGFSGRCLDDHDKTAKYVNSPDTPLFHKSRVLYALDKARRNIVESREAIICEGQIDVIRCHSAGFKTAVASQGTAFTEDHMRTLRRYADSVVLVFDSDKAGQDAAIRTAGTFMGAGLAVRVAALPQKEDPDSFIRENGPDAFRDVLARASSAVRFQIDVLSSRENARSEIGVMRIARAVLETVKHSPNAVQKAKLIQEAAERLGIPATALQDDLRFMTTRQSRDAEADTVDESTPQKERLQPKEEVELCEHLVHIMDFPQLAPLVRDYLPLSLVSDPLCRAVVKAALESAETGKDLQDVLRAQEDTDGELQSFAARVQMAPSKALGEDFGPTDAVKGQILHIWQKQLKQEREELEKKHDTTTEKRRVQITTTLDLFKNRKWTEEVAAVIKIEMELAAGH